MPSLHLGRGFLTYTCDCHFSCLLYLPSHSEALSGKQTQRRELRYVCDDIWVQYSHSVLNILSILIFESELVVFKAKVIRLPLEHLTNGYLPIEQNFLKWFHTHLWEVFPVLKTSLPGNHWQNCNVAPGLLCHPFAIWQPSEALKQLFAFSLSP